VKRTQVAPFAGRTERRDGGRAITAIRPVRPQDLAELGGFFAGLSVESRYLRFFAPVTPTHDLLDLLAGQAANVDAIVAVADGEIVGHAMAADGRRGQATDVGVVVADAWQRHGVGAALMRALVARAQARGVTSLAMDVLPGNRQVLAMIIGHWPDAAIAHSPDSLDIRIPLPRYQPRRQQQPRRQPPRPASGLVRPLVTLGG
jgi:GNAT superfamily N-acetyltransferase